MAVALFGATVTCVEQPTSPEREIVESERTAALSTPITQTLLTAGNDVVNKKIYTTSSISPAPNALITVAVLSHRASGAPVAATVTGGGMAAWAQVATVTFATIGTPQKRLTIYRALSASPGSGPITISFSQTVAHAQWIVSQWSGVDLSGANGAGAIVQSGSAGADAGNGLTVTLTPFADPNNVAYGVFGVKKKAVAVTPGAGFTEIAEQPSVESTPSDLQAEWATNDNTINASWTNLSAAALGVEIRAGTGGGGGGGVSASQSTVTADVSSIPVSNGVATITVTAKDASGDPVSGATVVLSATGTGNTLTQPAGPTNQAGVAIGMLSSSVAGTKIVSATANGTAITETVSVQVVAAATITHTLLTAGKDTVNQKIYTTASISPAPNTLVTLAVVGHRNPAAPSPTVTGGGMAAWDEVATVTFDTISVPAKRLTIYRAMSASPGSGPITISFSQTVSNALWIVSQWNGVDPSGENGAGAIVQTGSARADAGTSLAVTLAPFAHANNVAYGAFGVKKNALAVTPGAGFTEISEQPSGENTTSDLQAEWATNDNTIDASWATTKSGALGLEIKAANTGSTEPVVSVDVSPGSANVLVGATVQLTATAQDAEGFPLPGRPITWETNAPGVATVSATGLVTGVGAGAATISATSEGQTGTAAISVTVNSVPVASVEVTPATASVPVDATVQLTATAKDAAGQPLTGRSFTWATSAPGVATVSAGIVTGVTQGSATITATSEGKSGTAAVTVTAGGQTSVVGQWSSVLPAPIVQLHQQLLPDGRVLSWGLNGDPQLWDPATGNFTAVPAPSWLFCAGHDFLPDGRLLVAGGNISFGHGLRDSNIFDPVTGTWQVGPPMAQGRWYPTNTTLPNGEVLTLSGEDENGAIAAVPEIWNGTSWRQLTTASLELPNYPRTFVAPDGRVFYAGAQRQTRWLDVSGTGSWTNGPLRQFGSRSYGSAVMYAPGKILYAGGNNPPTNTAEIIDLNQPNPQWTYTGSLAVARWNLNATVLPTGEVLVTGGVAGDRANPALKVNTTELWNPATGSWATVASSAPLLRGYHSTTLLLPDGRVLHSGGGDGGNTVDNFNYELYSPPYLFRGARPTITGATPSVVGYGQSLSVTTPDGASIAKVSFIRLPSVTHAFDQGTRFVPLTFSQVAGGISVTLPTSRAVAPPGPYMVFLVNGNGVPSIARLMRLQ
ncbi:MAG TPA: galactose oxidase-like domain-containing protein [Gemmatimonadales bacterium]